MEMNHMQNNRASFQTVTHDLTEMLRWEICEGSALNPREMLSPRRIDAVYFLADRHSLSHLVADALWKQKDSITDPEMLAKVKMLRRNAFDGYIMYYITKEIAFETLCEQFEKSRITYVPLKGMELRRLWPEDWMRSCSDIDILIKKEELDKAKSCLEQIGYTYTGRTAHDISLFSEKPIKVHVELHYDTVEEEYLPQAQIVLADIWSYAEPVKGGIRYCLQPEMLYFYHVAHMVKHFQHGGCGIRFFIDLWLMETKLQLNVEKKNELLKKGGLKSLPMRV